MVDRADGGAGGGGKRLDGDRPAYRRFAGGGNRNPERLTGAIKAVDPVTGETKGQIRLDYQNFGGILATAGGLVFTGEGNGWFRAYDAKTGNVLWAFQAGAGVNAPPSLL